MNDFEQKVYFPYDYQSSLKITSGKFPEGLNLKEEIDPLTELSFAKLFQFAQDAAMPYYLVSVAELEKGDVERRIILLFEMHFQKENAFGVIPKELVHIIASLIFKQRPEYLVFDGIHLYMHKYRNLIGDQSFIGEDQSFICPMTQKTIVKAHHFFIHCFKYDKFNDTLHFQNLANVMYFECFNPKNYDPGGIDETFIFDALNYKLLESDPEQQNHMKECQKMIFSEILRSYSIIQNVQNKISSSIYKTESNSEFLFKELSNFDDLSNIRGIHSVVFSDNLNNSDLNNLLASADNIFKEEEIFSSSEDSNEQLFESETPLEKKMIEIYTNVKIWNYAVNLPRNADKIFRHN